MERARWFSIRRAVLLQIMSALFVALLLLQTEPGASAQDGTPEAEPSPARTDVRLFVPAGPDGPRAWLDIVAEEEGTCFAGSAAAASRSDAWRCGVGNGILDPCFADPFLIPGETGTLYCAADPFALDLIALTLTEPLPEEGGNDPTEAPVPDGILPWALELTTGEQCTLLTGATAPVAGQRLNYLCEGGASVVGDLDRSQPLWAVNSLAEDGHATTLVGVAVVWT